MENEKNDRKDDDRQESFNSFADFISFVLEKINTEISEDQPFIYGFSIIRKDDEKPSFYGINVSPPEPEDKKDMFVGGLHPLIEVTETETEVYVTIDTRQDDSNVSFKSESDSVEVEIELPEERYSEKIELPSPVEPSSAIFTCINGVLDIRYSRLVVT